MVRDAVATCISSALHEAVCGSDLGDSGASRGQNWLSDSRATTTPTRSWQRSVRFPPRRLQFAFPTRNSYVERPAAPEKFANGSGISEASRRLTSSAASADELSRLAPNSSGGFAPAKRSLRAGDSGRMFVVHDGRVDVKINDRGEPRTAACSEGDFSARWRFSPASRAPQRGRAGEPRCSNCYGAMKPSLTQTDLVESLSLSLPNAAPVSSPNEAAEADTETSAGILASIKRFFRLS